VTPNRRDFLMLASAAAPLVVAAKAQAQTRAPAAPQTGGADVHWLDGEAPAIHEGQTWGMPWPKGAHKKDASFALGGANATVPMQTWPIAWWPDGSIKWTAHSLPANAELSGDISVGAGRAPAAPSPIRVSQGGDVIEVSTGDNRWRIPRSGQNIIASASVGGRETLRDVRLVAMTQDKPDFLSGSVTSTDFVSQVEKVTVEQDGPIRAVVKIDGKHSGSGRAWLPFSLRLYFTAGSQAVKIMHSFIFDGDENKDFIRALGLTGSVPMSDEMHNRHIRFGGQGDGIFAEAVRGLTGLRREPGAAFRRAQIAGEKTPPTAEMSRQVGPNLGVIPAWGDYTLAQPNPDGYWLRKRTKDGCGWIDIDGAARASGLGYVGGSEGGVAFAMENFWKRFPVQLDIRNAHTDLASFNVWLYSPEAHPMDMRFFHDGMGMDTYPEQNVGLDVTYEDFEPGWGTPHGIARTNEITLWALPKTPTREHFAQMSRNIQAAPRLQVTPARLQVPGVLSDWSLPDRSSPTRVIIEDQNDYLLNFYMGQQEERRWYGFWSHGDVMHSYDFDRHVWKYDVGGFAWDNSELSTDLWLWYSYVRTGRADLFRFCEAMTRHTREVDCYHLGPWAGFGSRHAVQHWGDSSKQPRVSNAAYARIYYYLTGGDERTGDLMRELLHGDELFATVFIGRKSGRPMPQRPNGVVGMSLGTDWASFCAAWFTEWERTGDNRWRDKIRAGMETIAKFKYGWFGGSGDFDTRTGRFVSGGDRLSVSHLQSVFGAFETHSEMFKVMDIPPAYREVWLEYCAMYNAPGPEFQAKYGSNAGGRSLRDAYSRGTAFAAYHRGDKALAERAWQELFDGGIGLKMPQRGVVISGSDVLKPVDENARVSTNGSADWGLSAIMNLALISDTLESAKAKAPPEVERTDRPGSS